MMSPKAEQFLNQYLATLTSEQRKAIPQTVEEQFCADEYNVNECARLINAGVKRASCSLKAGYDIEDEPLPEVGRLSVVLNWLQQPVCIIKITHVELCPFDQVTPEFAAKEGEGDLSYQWWHDAHIQFFTQYAKEIGTSFSTQSELVLEHFEKVFPLNN